MNVKRLELSILYNEEDFQADIKTQMIRNNLVNNQENRDYCRDLTILLFELKNMRYILENLEKHDKQ